MSTSNIKRNRTNANTYLDIYSNTVTSCIDIVLNDNETNAKLINYNDYIEYQGYKIYGHPDKWIIDYDQSYNNCRMVSMLNIMAIYNKKSIKNNVIDEYEFSIKLLDNGYGDSHGPIYSYDDYGNINYYPGTNTPIILKYTEEYDPVLKNIEEDDGGLFVSDTIEYFRDYEDINVEAKINYNLDAVGEDIQAGKGVILSVNAETLWDYTTFPENKKYANHAILVLGALYQENILVGFFICDTGNPDDENIRYISKTDLDKAWNYDCTYDNKNNLISKRVATVTTSKDSIIKQWADDLDATGNANNNIITGNRGSNILEGLAGNDILIGNKGQDKLYGGDNNDVLIAGETGIYETNEQLRTIYNNRAYIEPEIENFYTDEDTEVEFQNLYSNKEFNNQLYGGNNDDLLIGNKYKDIMVAGSGNDYLYGGKGNDILCNYENSAHLYGGLGFDQYKLMLGTNNIIKDTDNKGSVYLREYWVRGASKEYYLGGNVWFKDGIRYFWDEVNNILHINNSTIIQNYHYNALNIRLEKPTYDPDPEPEDDDMSEPIVLDITGDGLRTTDIYTGTYVDFNNDGFAERVAWAGEGNENIIKVKFNDKNSKIA